MRIVAGVAIALALAAVGGATAASPALVAFTAGEFSDNGDVVVVDATGTVATNLTPGKGNVWDDDRLPSWSPDGSRLAFVSHRDGASTQEIYVMNADGSAPKRLTTDSGSAQVFNVDPSWSPNGTLIAWRKVTGGASDVWVMGSDGTGKRRLTSDAARKSAPQWSPDSKTLLYARQDPYAIQTVDVASGTLRNLSPPGAFDSLPRWSPDGTRIAFTGTDAIFVMSADGGGRRQLTRTRSIAPSWAPDGQSLVFGSTRVGPARDRFGPSLRADVSTIDVDGSDERRLTGPLGDEFVFGGESGAPSFWPDGSRIFFSTFRTGQAAETIHVMNVDGSCETVFTTKVPRLLTPPVWRPGPLPTLPPLSCIDLRVRVTPSSDAVALNGQLGYVLTIENDGTLPATGVRLTATVAAPGELHAATVDQSCTVGATIVCQLPTIAPRARLEASLTGRFPRQGAVIATFKISASQEDSDPSTDEAKVSGTMVLPCTIVGTMGNDAIYGTPKRDRICARAGWDRIVGRSGNDVIDAGNGDDTVEGNKGRDTITGSGGRDVILVRDGERDTVDCGTEADVVVADRLDRVARNCEEVIRG